MSAAGTGGRRYVKVDGKELHDQFQRGYLHGNSGFLYKGVAIHVAVPTKVTTGFADKLLQCDTADAAAALLAQYAKQPLERQAEGGGACEAGDIGPVFVATKEPIPGYNWQQDPEQPRAYCVLTSMRSHPIEWGPYY